MPSMPATRRASAASSTEQHPCLFFPPDVSQLTSSAVSTPLGEPRRINTPTTSYPSRSKSAAATELSTPPLMATTTFLREAEITVDDGMTVGRGRQRESFATHFDVESRTTGGP